MGTADHPHDRDPFLIDTAGVPRSLDPAHLGEPMFGFRGTADQPVSPRRGVSDFIADLEPLLAAMKSGPQWAPKFTDRPQAEFLAEVEENTVTHGDAGSVLWLVQDDADPDDVTTVAVTGNGPHGQANAEAIAFLVNNASAIRDALAAAAEREQALEAVLRHFLAAADEPRGGWSDWTTALDRAAAEAREVLREPAS